MTCSDNMHRFIALVSLVVISVLPTQSMGQHPLVSIPYEATYLLPTGFHGNPNESFVNGTTTSNQTLDALLKRASTSPFISYSSEFTALLPENPEAKLVHNSTRPDQKYAFEAGIWVPQLNEVWFASASFTPPAFLSKLDLATGNISRLHTDPEIVNPNGGYLFDGKVYVTSFADNTTVRGSVFSVDPTTRKATTLLNSYFGLQFNGIDDIVGLRCNGKRYIYFTDLKGLTKVTGYQPPLPSQFPAQVWRFDLDDRILLPVLSSVDIGEPNGIRVSKDLKTLYVGDSTAYSGLAEAGIGGPTVYKYDLDEECLPVNRRLFSLAREGIADGLHVDDQGRVWTGEYEGIVVRSPQGKVLGLFNAQAFLLKPNGTKIANFALAGDTLVVLAVNQIWTVKLAQTVVSEQSPIVG